MPSRRIYTEAADSMDNTLVEGDYVLANIRDYYRTPGAYNSGTSRRMVKGTVIGFAGSNKLRMMVENVPEWNPDTSWVSSRHATLIAPKAMADSYKEALAYYTESDH